MENKVELKKTPIAGIFSSATKIVLLMITLAVIVMTFMWIEITEPMKTISIMVVSFYFWQKQSNK